MAARILLTGRPGIGKTTVVRRVLECCRGGVGFTTRERRRQGRRVGFGIDLTDGRGGLLAEVDPGGLPRVGRYGVHLEFLEEVTVPFLRAVIGGAQPAAYLVLDEIGKMECLSEDFVACVAEAFSSDLAVLGTVPVSGCGPAAELGSRDDVSVLEVTEANREPLVRQLCERLTEGADR